jgi:UDP-N-acetylglucosamine/UDP-N-acetylgalactosamine 4-epimerase
MSALGNQRYEALRGSLSRSPRVWLITGVAGFIGSNLLSDLVSLGQTVVGLDNFSTGHRANIADVLAATGASSRFRMIEGDTRDIDACRAACAGVDYVLHQAALGSVPRSIHDPLTSSHVNVDGLMNVLFAAHGAGVKRVVYASSSSVYGDSPNLPQVEARTGRLLSPYAATKAANEMYADVFQRTYGIETVGLRYFNVFGPRQDPNGAYAAVIPRWIAALLRGEPCHIFGDGKTSRDFCYIANVVQANLLAATADASATGECYNIACGDSTSLTALFYLIRDGLAKLDSAISSAEPRYDPFRPGDINQSFANISKAIEALGYAPSHRIREGMDATLAWYIDQAASQVG